jgi:hypothetical protein
MEYKVEDATGHGSLNHPELELPAQAELSS